MSALSTARVGKVPAMELVCRFKLFFIFSSIPILSSSYCSRGAESGQQRERERESADAKKGDEEDGGSNRHVRRVGILFLVAGGDT